MVGTGRQSSVGISEGSTQIRIYFVKKHTCVVEPELIIYAHERNGSTAHCRFSGFRRNLRWIRIR